MSKFLSEKYKGLEPYTPGEQPRNAGLIKLNTNESPYDPSPKVIEAINQAETEKLRLYSDPEIKELVCAIADYYDLEDNQVFAGNGSDEILAFSFMAFQQVNRKIYFPAISYGFYPVYGAIFEANAKPIPLTEDLCISIKDYRNLDGTIVIANPNAPTGRALSRLEIEEILKSNRDNLVLVDEAYVDFGAESCVPLIAYYDNLLVVQTFSKSRSLAGARIGFALGNQAIIEDLNKIKFSFNPYNLNRLSILAGTAAIKDDEYFQTCINKIVTTREAFVNELSLLGFKILPSKANFVFAKHEKLQGDLYLAGLRKNNILVRHFTNPFISDYVRITIGLPQDMGKLLTVTKQLLLGR